jgi:translation initiation factor eIF-2B subunit alpha
MQTLMDNLTSAPPASLTMSPEQVARNPDVDYTRSASDTLQRLSRTLLILKCRSPDLISLVFSDVGSLTPEGVSQYLVGMFAG